jgi:hypothetical protein
MLWLDDPATKMAQMHATSFGLIVSTFLYSLYIYTFTSFFTVLTVLHDNRRRWPLAQPTRTCIVVWAHTNTCKLFIILFVHFCYSIERHLHFSNWSFLVQLEYSVLVLLTLACRTLTIMMYAITSCRCPRLIRIFQIGSTRKPVRVLRRRTIDVI